MDTALFLALALGFLAGFKHAFEPDHVIAVSTLIHRRPSLWGVLRSGLAWGAGHTTTLALAVLAVGALQVQLSEAMLGYLEIPVALMLLALGAWALWDGASRFSRLRRHDHDAVPHYHVGDHPHPHGFPVGRTGWQGYCVGLVHGLAGSGALLVLVAATLPSATLTVAYALIFGLGSILGMGAVTLALALPLLASRKRPLLFHSLTGLAGALSVLLGASILYGVLPA